MSTEAIYTFDVRDLPHSAGGLGSDVPVNIIFHVDLPWLSVITESYSVGDKISVHFDPDLTDGEDRRLAMSLIPAYSLRLPDRDDIRTLGVDNEVTISYWRSF